MITVCLLESISSGPGQIGIKTNGSDLRGVMFLTAGRPKEMEGASGLQEG